MINLGFLNVNTTGYGGSVSCSGLPFAAVSNVRGGGAITVYNVTIPNEYVIALIGGTTVSLYSPKTNDGWNPATYEGVVSTYIEMTLSYRVA